MYGFGPTDFLVFGVSCITSFVLTVFFGGLVLWWRDRLPPPPQFDIPEPLLETEEPVEEPPEATVPIIEPEPEPTASLLLDPPTVERLMERTEELDLDPPTNEETTALRPKTPPPEDELDVTVPHPRPTQAAEPDPTEQDDTTAFKPLGIPDTDPDSATELFEIGKHPGLTKEDT